MRSSWQAGARMAVVAQEGFRTTGLQFTRKVLRGPEQERPSLHTLSVQEDPTVLCVCMCICVSEYVYVPFCLCMVEVDGAWQPFPWA